MAGRHYDLDRMSMAANQIVEAYEQINIIVSVLEAVTENIQEQWQSEQSICFQKDCQKMRIKLKELQNAIATLSKQLTDSANVIIQQIIFTFDQKCFIIIKESLLIWNCAGESMSGGDVMQKRKNMIIVILLFTVLAVGCAGTSDKSKCKNVLKEFEFACNNLDADAILTSIHPNIADPIRFGLATMKSFSGDSTDAILEKILDGVSGGIESLGSNLSIKSVFSTFSIDPEKFNIHHKYAEVRCTVSFQIQGMSFERLAVFNMEKYNKKWYISSFEILLSDEE